MRRIIKSRSILVKSLVALKNQIHGLLLSYGIESSRGELQSTKARQRILCDLEDHDFNGSATITVKPLFDTIDNIQNQIKELEKILNDVVQRTSLWQS